MPVSETHQALYPIIHVAHRFSRHEMPTIDTPAIPQRMHASLDAGSGSPVLAAPLKPFTTHVSYMLSPDIAGKDTWLAR